MSFYQVMWRLRCLIWFSIMIGYGDQLILLYL